MTMPTLMLADLNLPDVNESFRTLEELTLEQIPGEIAESVMAFDDHAANLVLASPNGSTGEPTFRALVTADLPDLGVTTAKIANDAVTDGKLRNSAALSVIGRSANSSGDPADIAASADGQVLRRAAGVLGFGAMDLDDSDAVTGTLGLANGGTNADLSATGGASQVLKQTSAGANVTVGQLAAADLSDFVAWTDVSFNAGNFTGGGAMTWTVASGDVVTNRYMKIGKLLIWTFYITATDIGGVVAATVNIAIPGGYTSAKQTGIGHILINDNGTWGGGHAFTTGAGGTTIFIMKENNTNWTASAGATAVHGTVMLEVQ